MPAVKKSLQLTYPTYPYSSVITAGLYGNPLKQARIKALPVLSKNQAGMYGAAGQQDVVAVVVS
jgi:hypothetical protein